MMKRRPGAVRAWLAALALAGLALVAPPGEASPETAGEVPPSQADPVDAESIDVQIDYQLRQDDSGLADLQITLRDRLSGQPVDYARRRLAGWLQRPLATLAEAELRCSDKIRLLATPGPGRRAAVDLNTFRLLAVNQDRSLTFINPFLRVNNAKLESIVTLPGDVQAVLHRPLHHEVWLALPDQDTVLVVDTDARRIAHTHQLDAGSAPISLTEAGDSVWVAQRGRDAWLRFAHANAKPDAIAAPRVHTLVTVPGQNAPIGLAGPGEGIVRFDGDEPVRDAAGETVVSVVWSGLAQRLLLSTVEGGLRWLNLRDGSLAQRVTMPPASLMAGFDDGRYLLAVSADALRVIDVGRSVVSQTHPLTFAVSGLGMTDGFAYLHAAGSARASLFSLAGLRQGRLQPAEVAVGADRGAVFSTGTKGSTPVGGAALMMPIPDGSGMYFANPLDGQIYQYAEGMMAPAGSFSNYRRSPVALLLLDGGLQPVGQGVYRTVVAAPEAGRYEWVLSGVAPRFASCGSIAIAGPPAVQPNAGLPHPQARLLGIDRHDADGSIRVRAELIDAREHTVDGPVDLTLLAFDRYTGWQRRVVMVATAPRVYEARLKPPAAARLDLRVGSRAGDLPFHAGGLGAWPPPDANGVVR